MNSFQIFFKKRWWYIILLIMGSIYVFINRFGIFSFEKFNAPHLIFIIWLILLLQPLFSEIEILGFKIKKEIAETKLEVKSGMSELKSQILDFKIENNLNNNLNIFTSMPSDQNMDRTLNEIKLEPNNKTIVYNQNKSISKDVINLFEMRYSLENELFTLCEKADLDIRIPRSIIRMAESLVNIDVINVQTLIQIKQVLGILNRGIHGEIVSEKYIMFINQVMPVILDSLSKAEVEKLDRYCICPRCKYSGPAKYDNVCPKCGNIHDDD